MFNQSKDPFEWHDMHRKHDLIPVQSFCANCFKKDWDPNEVKKLKEALKVFNEQQLEQLGVKRL